MEFNYRITKMAEETDDLLVRNSSYILLKRVIDIVFSLLGIVFLLPVFILVGVSLKIEDPRAKILFKQKRVTEMGKEFYIYKFRSMITNAEERLGELMKFNEATGPMFKMKSDPRVTRVGSFLRKTSLDELPQLFNVLFGDMSLVGPRPPLPKEVETYSEYQLQRLLVPQGLTCFWQVEGRSNIGFEEQVELDLKYIKNRSLLLDIKLILRTIKVLIGSKDAY
ncbi:sugar transferase [Halobacillus trueperi]|uniref:sugar transferase n=1 Tax=Halobacillus trueperi TaxID=156205 RepID=UPI003736DFBC